MQHPGLQLRDMASPQVHREETGGVNTHLSPPAPAGFSHWPNRTGLLGQPVPTGGLWDAEGAGRMRMSNSSSWNKPGVLKGQCRQAREGSASWSPGDGRVGIPWPPPPHAQPSRGRGREHYPAVCKPQKAKQTVLLSSQARICLGHLENLTRFPNLR